MSEQADSRQRENGMAFCRVDAKHRGEARENRGVLNERLASRPLQPHQHRPAWVGKSLMGLFLASFASLLLELSLTRLFSVVLFYHMAFLAVSLALLGLGAGGVFAYTQRDQLNRWWGESLPAQLCLLNAIAVCVALLVVLRAPVRPQAPALSSLSMVAMFLAAAAPFFFTGLLFASLFARASDRITHLYAADLLGGAAACVAAVPLLNWLGAPNVILLAGLTLAGTAALWAATRNLRISGMAVAAVIVLMLVSNLDGQRIDVKYVRGRSVAASAPRFVKWNALSRVQVDAASGPLEIGIDGDAATRIADVSPNEWEGTGTQQWAASRPSAIVNVLRPKGSFAIIGAGGGTDVLRAVASGSQEVTAIEINPAIVREVMRGQFAEYSHNLYDRPEVRVQVAEGRAWIRGSGKQFDVVEMTLVDTWASTAAGALALSESNCYTVEAFLDYFSHLKAEGLIAATRWEFEQPREALRVVSLGIEALHRLGVGDARRHFLVVSDGVLDDQGRLATVLTKKSPFTAEEESAVLAYLAEHPNLVALYMPSDLTGGASVATANRAVRGSSVFSALISSQDVATFAGDYPYEIRASTDDNPFFFFTFKTGQVLAQMFDGKSGSTDWRVNLGVLVLVQALAFALVTVIAVLILPLRRHARGHSPFHPRLLYFVAIGLGYILVEIAFIQRFVLFLGHPTYALTVAVFLLLMASGWGSLLAARLLPEPSRVRRALALIAVVILCYVFLLPEVLSSLVGLHLGWKVLICGLLLGPLGFVMGMPFPSGIRALDRSGQQAVEWAYALNAAATVLGSVLAVLLAIHFGLRMTLAVGAMAYLAAGVLTRSLEPAREVA